MNTIELPNITFNGGAILSLVATRLLCEDETEHEGAFGVQGEGLANDAIKLGGVFTTAMGAGGEPRQFRIAGQNLGDNYEDGRLVNMEIELGRFFISGDQHLPTVCNAMIFLVEDDWGGTNWDSAVRSVIDTTSGALRSGVTSAVSAAAATLIGTSAGALAGPIGAGIGALAGLAVAAIADGVKNTESDIFPALDTMITVNSIGQRTSQVQHLRFAGHGGQYLLTLEWRLRPLPQRMRRVALQASNGSFVGAHGDRLRPLSANRPQVREWETFGLLELSNSNVALMSYFGDFVVADGGGGSTVSANRPEVLGWETFNMRPANGGVSFRTASGNFLMAENGGGNGLNAVSRQAAQWETFTMVPA